jgi:polar amino acid transport system substrate-binding protein/glutamate/aspartate transport system substrate-binding protein
MQRSIAAAFLTAALIAAQGCAFAQSAPRNTLERIRQTKTVRIAYRADAPPFSVKTSAPEPGGFMVELCRAVVAQIGQQTGLGTLNISYVQVTSTDRFDAIAQGKADMLCEPTSATLSRRKIVDFSIPTYIDGAGIIVAGDAGPRSFEDLSGKPVGVLAGTTTETALRNSLRDLKISATVVPVKTHDEGMQLLAGNKIAAYFADRTILLGLVAQSGSTKYAIIDQYLTMEPYALALPRGDEDFRLAVDTALSRIYRSGQIGQLFNHTFQGARPGAILQSLYLISAYPE